MIRLGVSAVCAMVISAVAAGAQTAAPGSPEVVASGWASVPVVADRAVLEFSIVGRADRAGAGSEHCLRQHAAVEEALHALGVTDEDMAESVSIVQPDFGDHGRRPQSNYVASRRLRITTGQLALLGKIADAALDAGAERLGHITFVTTKSDSARSEALAAAVRQAQADARVMAEAAGGVLGPLIELKVQEPPRLPLVGETEAGRAVFESTVTTPTQLFVTIIVTGRWQFTGGISGVALRATAKGLEEGRVTV